MNKSRLVEVSVVITLLVSILLYWFFGFLYFAGFEYAPTIIKIVLIVLTVNIYFCLLYFIYRLIRWMIKIIARLVIHKS